MEKFSSGENGRIHTGLTAGVILVAALLVTALLAKCAGYDSVAHSQVSLFGLSCEFDPSLSEDE